MWFVFQSLWEKLASEVDAQACCFVQLADPQDTFAADALSNHTLQTLLFTILTFATAMEVGKSDVIPGLAFGLDGRAVPPCDLDKTLMFFNSMASCKTALRILSSQLVIEAIEGFRRLCEI